MERSAIALLLALPATVLPACAPGSAGPDIDGLWQGRLELPGLELRIVLEITTLPDGTIQAILLRPDEGNQ